MPRRQKDDAVTDTTTEETTTQDAESAPVAGGSETPETTEAAKRSTVDDLPLGPTKTRTGAEATVIQGPKGKRVFTAGGDKGAKIKELLETRKDLSRKEIAELVGSSQSRVAEVARVLGLSSARPEPKPADASTDQAADGVAAEPAPETVSAAT